MNKKINRLLKGALAFTVAFSTLAVTTSTSRSVSAVEQEESYTQYVDPFVCTDVDYGQLFPGSVVPNGVVKLSPDKSILFCFDKKAQFILLAASFRHSGRWISPVSMRSAFH